jgi:hypothetical protein
MKYSIAVMALLGLVEAKHHHKEHQNVQFVDGDFDNMNFLDKAQDFNFAQKYAPYSPSIGVRFVQSDPIHGSLGPAPVADKDMT